MVAPLRLRTFLEAESRATGLPVGRLVVAAALIHAVVAVLAVNPWHPDEHFQILEFAWARSGLASTDGLPWEWDARIRPTLQPALALVVLQALRALGIDSPFAWALTLRLATLAVALAVMLGVVSRVAPTLAEGPRRLLWGSALLLWFTPLFLFRFSSENLGGLALTGALLVVERASTPRRDLVAGALLGLAFLFRFQMAFAAAALLGWVALRTVGGRYRAGRMTLAAAGVVAAGVAVDAWFYGGWVFTPWRYVDVNLVQGVASTFGTSPWYAYLIQAPLWMAPPLGLAVAALVVAGLAAHPGNPWSWTFVAFLVGHALVPHKELRFLLPLLYWVPVLAARGADVWWGLLTDTRWKRGVGWALVAQNVLLLALLLTPAVHRGREVDVHYLRWLRHAAEAHPGEGVWVLTDEPSPWRIHGLETAVYRHPGVVTVAHRPGDPVPGDVPAGVPPDRLLLLSRGDDPPRVAGARVEGPVYRAEAGVRVLARRLGAEAWGAVAWLEALEGWSGAPEVRRLFRVVRPSATGGGP